MKHTPGPWELTGMPMFRGIMSAKDMPIFILDRCCGSREECEANARLIAAAPQLLDACRQFVNAIDTGYMPELICAYDSAVRAIKKAEIEQPPQIERAYCLGCRTEIMTESGQLCQQCGSVATIEIPGPEGAR